jgi:hypothetical protein
MSCIYIGIVYHNIASNSIATFICSLGHIVNSCCVIQVANPSTDKVTVAVCVEEKELLEQPKNELGNKIVLKLCLNEGCVYLNGMFKFINDCSCGFSLKIAIYCCHPRNQGK